MSIILQHSTDLGIAKQICGSYNASFKTQQQHIRLDCETAIDLPALRLKYQTDFNYLPNIDFTKIKLFISDMDSTLIAIESIDEIADFAGVKRKVADITQRAMDGELDFDAALIERTALLRGLDASVLNRVYTERLQITKGGEALIKFLTARNILSSVVSGGFDYFTERLSKAIGLRHNRASQLEIKDGLLTGKIIPPIINAQSKADFVAELALKYQASAEQIIVVGDGANDLKMMKKAGAAIAFHAKPIVIKNANINISFGGLDKISDFFT